MMSSDSDSSSGNGLSRKAITIKILRLENQRLREQTERLEQQIEDLRDELVEYKCKITPPPKRIDECSEFAANLMFKKEVPAHEVQLRCAAINYSNGVGKMYEESLAVDLTQASLDYVRAQKGIVDEDFTDATFDERGSSRRKLTPSKLK